MPAQTNVENVSMGSIRQGDILSHYNIAGLDIAVRGAGQIFMQQSIHYRIPHYEQEPSILIDITDSLIKHHNSMYPCFTKDECTYILSSDIFCENILNHSGFILHASAVVLDGNAYLFSAPSGTGKSTHTSLWLNTFGVDKAHILNDDKPAIRKIGSRYYAFGTPWSGKSSLNVNESVPLQSIAFIERSDHDWIRSMQTSEALFYLMSNIVCKKTLDNFEKLIPLIDGLISEVALFHMGCTMSEDAVKLAYNTMRRGRAYGNV